MSQEDPFMFEGAAMITHMEETGQVPDIFSEYNTEEEPAEVTDPKKKVTPIVFDLSKWLNDPRAGGMYLAQGPQQARPSTSPQNWKDARHKADAAPRDLLNLHDGLDLVGMDTHTWTLAWRGDVRRDVYFNYAMENLFQIFRGMDRCLGGLIIEFRAGRLDNGPGYDPTIHTWFSRNTFKDKDFKEVQDRGTSIFKNMARIKADLMDQAVENARAKRANTGGDTSTPVPKVKQRALPIKDARAIDKSSPIWAYAEAYRTWYKAQGGDVTTTPRGPGLSMVPASSLLPAPTISGGSTSTTHVPGASISPTDFTFPASSQLRRQMGTPGTPTPLSNMHKSTGPATSPTHIFDSSTTKRMVHSLGKGKLITEGPTSAFQRLVFMRPSDDEDYAKMGPLRYTTRKALDEYKRDFGEKECDELEYDLKILYWFDHPGTWTESVKERIPGDYWKNIFPAMCMDKLLDICNGVFN
ncbi:hypothetical protein CALVIDRAFT_566228 [Calocera viscosa TUFC12733]|uniref:Uncharacterized protein n=1 Tax=Calocera viscosa (strain TUFC12733) TaxID=1330018 RepID=A0A167JNG7_CALVF|nr:hypothetical protein CALVIDRAFT_566228 [Calocera viscosa TUFC12733]